MKLDSGTLRIWGRYDERAYTGWTLLGGPIIGFNFKQEITGNSFFNFKSSSMHLIMGDSCRPKYFGVRKLTVNMGEELKIKFYWHESYPKWLSECLSKGLFYVQNPEQFSWIDIVNKKAVIFPKI